jgi:hypothetical protein
MRTGIPIVHKENFTSKPAHPGGLQPSVVGSDSWAEKARLQESRKYPDVQGMSH